MARLPRPLGRPIGWYRQNRVLFWLCALIGVNQLGFGSVVPVAPLYALEFGVSQTAIGLTVGVYGLARFLLNVPGGQLADLAGRRATLALGGALTVVGNLVCAVAPDYPVFLLGRFVAGAGAALVITGSQIALADVSTPERRGRMMALYSGTFTFAVGAGPIPGGLLADRFGLWAPFLFFAVAATVTTTVALFCVPETRGLRDGGTSPAGASAPAPSFARQLRIMSADVGFLLICLISFGQAFARTGGLFTLIPILGKERLGLSADQIGLGLGFISIVALVLAYPAGAMADRLGRKTVIVPANVLSGLSFVLFLLAPSYGWFLLASLAWAISVGVGGAAPGAYAADRAPAGMNAISMSSYRMLSDVGYFVGPLLLGVSADLLGMNAALWGTALMMVAISLAFARWAPETLPRRARPLS